MLERRFGRGIDALEGEALRLTESVVIDLFQVRLHNRAVLVRFMDIVLVRRVARPVAARSVDLHDHQTVTWEAGRDDAIDLACGIIATANLHCDVLWCDQAWHVILIGWCQRDGVLAGSLC